MGEGGVWELCGRRPETRDCHWLQRQSSRPTQPLSFHLYTFLPWQPFPFHTSSYGDANTIP